MKRIKFIPSLCAVIISMLLATTNGVFAETDFSGKTIKWVVPFSQGGGADSIDDFLPHYSLKNYQAIQ